MPHPPEDTTHILYGPYGEDLPQRRLVFLVHKSHANQADYGLQNFDTPMLTFRYDNISKYLVDHPDSHQRFLAKPAHGPNKALVPAIDDETRKPSWPVVLKRKDLGGSKLLKARPAKGLLEFFLVSWGLVLL